MDDCGSSLMFSLDITSLGEAVAGWDGVDALLLPLLVQIVLPLMMIC